ncbi:sodium-dependent noradrenaline transporter-like [Anthonomus grandis grandis]|uniref:sodium-dependent noradrenaline transporter-like n=1 Tax=Anthonomus grandis grandis TaxID=2921223 RepID=UPI0021657ABD|nr:sodium-dependent noradrenaline transporter-like [Anthonomus grandis grandis]
MSHIYDNIPLKPFKREKYEPEQKSSSKISTVQKNLRQEEQEEEKRRKGSADLLRSCTGLVQKKTKSKSISEMFFRVQNGVPTDEFGSSETIKAEKSEEDLKKVTTIHSTPTSTLDDGYESSNSTPLVSGKGRTKHSSTTASMVITCTLRKKDLHVQLEEDEHESFVLSPTSSQAGEVDPDSFTAEDNRETWGSNTDFLLSIIGFAVDLANIWRFPYLCYRNGGGAFLIPYTLMLIFGAVPLFYMELILGQFNRQGPISLWRICPLFKGVGFCAVLVAFYVSFYYNVILAWALYYLGSSISEELPWVHCNNSWNTEKCWEMKNLNVTTEGLLPHNENVTRHTKHTAAFEFFHRAVLEMQWSDGLHEMGYPKWQLVVCLVMIYCLLYVSLFKGVKSSGKVVWVTATMPYVVLTILLVRGLMLPGALGGISYYLKPQLSKLKETQVWVDAAVQIFYSVGAGFGVHLSYASYNTFHNNCYRDCIITTIVNCFTSFFSGFVIFTYLGYMSYKQGVDIKYVATEGPGLVFQVYPEAVATLSGSNLWSVLFFFMLIMVGVDSAMGGLECVITGLMDEFSVLFREKKYAREVFTLVVILMSFSVALINVTPGGIYMFHLFDTYAAGISLLCSALFETVAVSWFYGLDRLSQDVEAMLGIKPGLYWRVCWKFISPSFIVCVVMFGLLYHPPLVYNDYYYPNWAEWVGWGLALSSILMIPIAAIVQLCKTPGSFKERLALSISPVEEHEDIRRSKLVRRFKAKHWLYV